MVWALSDVLIASTVHDSAVVGELEKIHAARITQGQLAVTCAHVGSSDVKPRRRCLTSVWRIGVTHWSSRLLAARLKVSASTVVTAWRAYGIHGDRGRSGSPPIPSWSARSTGSHPADPADAAGTDRATKPRLRSARHQHLVRGAGYRKRSGHRRTQAAAPTIHGSQSTSHRPMPRGRLVRHRRTPGLTSTSFSVTLR